MATNPYSNVSVSGYNSDAPTDDGSQTANNRVTWAKHKTKIGDPLKTAIEAIDQAADDAFATIAAILVDFTGDFGSGGVTGLVPAPAAGDAANNRFLRADGTWTTPAGAGSVTSVATGSGLTGGPITGSGTIALASIDNNTVLGNLSGVTAAPSAVLLPALLNALDVFQGDLGSGGVKGLVPAPAAGEDAYFLRGDGSWADPADDYSGTVTSVATGSGLTGGPITASGTISLASISDLTLLANVSGGSAAPSETNISELTPYLSAFGGDFGSGGSKGLVPAPLAGDAAKVLRADGTWATISGTGTVTSIDITAPAAGITASGGPVTVSGSITLALADDLAALEAMSSTGIVTRTASNTYAQRTITGTADQVTVTNGDGVSGNPTLSLPNSIVISGSITVGNTGIVVGASTPFSDSAGTLTLQNVDGLDATTEATIEAAIDTLANLTSIQGRTVTLADAGANAIFGWDDTAGAYENLSAAEATAVLSAFVGDSGAGGTKGLVPAPTTGDSSKYLKGDGTWTAIPGGGDMLAANNLSDVINVATARSNLGLGSILDPFIGDAGSGGGAGLVPAPAAGDDGKFLNGNGTWSAPTLSTKQIYTSGVSIWTKPLGLRMIRVTVTASGGSGASADNAAGSNASLGGGGGAGGTSIKWIAAASLNTTEIVTVGAAVAGPAGSAATNGTVGNASSFGAHCSANGGNAGNSMATGTTVTTNAAGGAGGTSSDGNINLSGGAGLYGLRVSGAAGQSGFGGASYWGGGPQGRGSTGDGASGVTYGVGGAGGASFSTTGGAGGDSAAGVVLVEEYY